MDEGRHLEELKTRVFAELDSCDLTNNKVSVKSTFQCYDSTIIIK